jgi:2-hydroxychromene-2-carboxylate isomerase
VPVDLLLDDARELPKEYIQLQFEESRVEEGPPVSPAELTPNVERLERGIATLSTHIADLTAKSEALNAKIAALDAALASHPAVAEALAAGLTIADVRALIRNETERRQARAKLDELKARAAAKLAGEKHRPEEKRA